MASGVRESPAGAITERKRAARLELRQRLSGLDRLTLELASGAVVRRLLSEEKWESAKFILGYSATGHELDLWPALEQAQAAGKTLTLPRYDPQMETYCAAIVGPGRQGLIPAAFGILEPPASAPSVPLNRLDFVVVPGLGFDSRGMRLGRGKGFYDRLLAQVNGTKCGIALDEQIIEELPAEPHDVNMNMILTPTRRLVAPLRGF